MRPGLVALLTTGLVLACLPAAALAQTDPQAVTEPGYAITDASVSDFFVRYGGEVTFGAPISRTFVLSGARVQLFENVLLQVRPDGSVTPLPLAARPSSRTHASMV